MYIDDAVTNTLRWEGSVAWMYLDTATPPNVTTGCGLLLATAAAACALPFKTPTGEPASIEQITEDFNCVRAQQGGRLASSYRSASSPLLAATDIQNLTREHILKADENLAGDFPGYAGYPDNAKLGLLDMAFNLGFAGLTKKFPNFCAAVREQNWAAAAAECRRGGISEERNQWTAALFSSITGAG